MNTPTFEEFSAFLRDFRGISSKTVIHHGTKLEAELSVTGDDGDDLLKETEERYGVSLSTPEEGYKSTFGLRDDEYLFHSEGFDLFGLLPKHRVIEFTVGHLYDAVKTKFEQSGADNPRPCGTSGMSDAEASAPPEASGGI